MKRKLRLGNCYALTKHKPKHHYLRYIGLLVVLTSMCLYARAQRPEPSGPVPSGIDTTTTTRDTIAIEEVEINTGYQRIPKERATGSFVFVDSALFNRTFSTNVLDRLNGIVDGLQLNIRSDEPDAVNITLRGPSTFQAVSQPLIILDNFEYQGDLNAINPNDVANITILRDAAASSIWGAKAGNGVIVITTKSGKYNQSTRLMATANVGVRERQQLYKQPTISSTDYIDLEIDLFNRGHYARTLDNINKPAVSPVVWILEQQRLLTISQQEATEAIDALRKIDSRDEMLTYFTRTRLSRQYALSLSGGGRNNQYYASAGWDDNRLDNVGDKYRRLSLTFNNTMGLLANKLQLKTAVRYTNSQDIQNGLNPVPGMNHPYSRVANDIGQPLEIARYRPDFIDTVGNGRLLDWTFRPLDELGRMDKTSTLVDLNVNLRADYKPTDWLKISIAYQYANGNNRHRQLFTEDSYYTRDLINTYSSITGNGEVIRAIPLGGILDLRQQYYTSHLGRGQVDLEKAWQWHEIQGLIGMEISNRSNGSNPMRYYGYDVQHLRSIPVDGQVRHRSMVTGLSNLQIPTTNTLTLLTKRFLSFYGNVSYGFRKKYWITASIRRDGSNLFGVNTNQKWSPLWSTGMKWVIDKEDFYALPWLPDLALRFTYGTSGNIDHSVTAYLLAVASSANTYGEQTMVMRSPPNPNLRWETVGTLNAAVDFSLFASRRIIGNVEVYRKIGRDLLSPTELSAVTGLTTYTGNTAALRGFGMDIKLQSKNLTGRFVWQTTLLYSHTRNQVTEYRVTPANNSSIISGYKRIGKPLEAIHVFKWGGLNPENGNPRGYVDGVLTEDYQRITTSTNLSDLDYIGTTRPPHYGAIRNDFTWHNLSLSFNITYKFGHYFRNELLNYSQLYSGSYIGANAAFANRWKMPGDERHTHVPSMVYPVIPSRDNFYTRSTPSMEKGDLIRLQDARLGYRLKRLSLFIMAENIALLWKASDLPIDPDWGYINRRSSYSAGVSINL